MLFANTWTAVNSFGSGNSDVVGDLFNQFYPPNSDNQTVQYLVVGHTNITWDPRQVYNESFFDSFSPDESIYLIFDVFGKIFESYSLHLPQEYEDLYHQLVDGQVPNDENTYQELILILIERFLVSAIYYQVACV